MFSLNKVVGKHKGRIFEKWVFNARSPLLSSAAVSDIDNDGLPEVVFGTKEGLIICLDHDSKEKWVFTYKDGNLAPGEEFFYDIEKLHSISSAPVLADINNDGKREVIFGTDEGDLIVLDPFGRELWRRRIGGDIKASPKVVDINHDGNLEIIVASTNKKLVVYTPNGDSLFSFEASDSIEGVPGVLLDTSPSLIIFGMNNGEVVAIDPSGSEVWGFKTGDKVTAEPAFFRDELVIIGSWDGSLYALSSDGELKWRFRTEGAIYNKAVIDDINNDGLPEVVFGSCDNRVYALTIRGELLWRYETDFWVVASPIVVDFDNDGAKEVIVGSYDNNLYVLEGAGSYDFDYVPGLSGIINQAGHYSDVLSREPGDLHGKRLWQYSAQGFIVGASLMDEPGNPKVVVNVKSGFVDAFVHKNL